MWQCSNLFESKSVWASYAVSPLRQDIVTRIDDRHSTSSSSLRQPRWRSCPNCNGSKESSQSLRSLRDTGSSWRMPATSMNVERQTSSTPLSNQVPYCRVYLDEDHNLTNCPIVKDPTRLSQLQEKGWETIKTRRGKQDDCSHGSGDRCWCNRYRRNDKNGKKDDAVQVAKCSSSQDKGKE